ncbi:hypothetical protein ABK040_004955 [Willaertia magna]
MELFKLAQHATIESIPLKESTTNNLIKDSIKFIKVGVYHLVVVTVNNEIYAFGRNNEGQLGTGHFRDKKEFTKITTGNEYNITHLECCFSTIFVNEMNEIYISGYLNGSDLNKNSFVKTDTNNNFVDDKIKFVRVGGLHYFIVTENNNLYAYGTNNLGQLGLQKEF